MIVPFPAPGRARSVYTALRAWYGPRVAAIIADDLEHAARLPLPKLARVVYLVDLGWDTAYVEKWLKGMGYEKAN